MLEKFKLLNVTFLYVEADVFYHQFSKMFFSEVPTYINFSFPLVSFSKIYYKFFY